MFLIFKDVVPGNQNDIRDYYYDYNKINKLNFEIKR